MWVFHSEKAMIMQKAHLHQQMKTNAGVLGTLQIGDHILQSIETNDCLKPGTYEIKQANGRYYVETDAGAYYITMDINGVYRNKGLVVGMEWDFRAFDVKHKGRAKEILCGFAELEGVELEVTSYSQTLKDTVSDLQKKRNQEKEEFEVKLQKALEEVTAERDAAIAERDEVTKEYQTFATRFKAK